MSSLDTPDDSKPGVLCGTCKLCSHVCGQALSWFVLFLSVGSNIVSASSAVALSPSRFGPQAIGVFLVLREQAFDGLPATRFESHSALGWASGLGITLCVGSVFGFLTLMPFCSVSRTRPSPGPTTTLPVAD
jgi:hypothetical protein